MEISKKVKSKDFKLLQPENRESISSSNDNVYEVLKFISSSFSHPENILPINIALDKSNCDISIEVNSLHPLNIHFILKTFDVSKLFRLIYFKLLHPQNRLAKLLTLDVSKLDKSKDINEVQPSNNPFIFSKDGVLK